MSYDVRIVTDAHPDCKAEHAWGGSVNMTSNVAPVWRAAGCNISKFHGQSAKDFLWVLCPAIARIEADPRAFDKYVRGDGTWGTVESALRFMHELVVLCEDTPDGRVEVDW